jgi:hypothetical protein
MSRRGSHPSLLMVSLSAGSPAHSLTLPKRRASQYAKSQVALAGWPGRGPSVSSSLWKRGGQLVLSCGALQQEETQERKRVLWGWGRGYLSLSAASCPEAAGPPNRLTHFSYASTWMASSALSRMAM